MKGGMVLLFLVPVLIHAQNRPLILPERDRARVINEVLAHRFEKVLPGLMRREGIDLWILISREYHEDPVMKTMLPAEWISARRRTVFVFFDKGADTPSVEQLAIARYDVGLLKASWNLNVYPDQWDALMEIIRVRQPKKIGINFSPRYAHADGLSHFEYDQFISRLPGEFKPRVVSAETLAVAWLETRSSMEMTLYEHIGRIAHQILREGLSDQVIQPGITTTEDLVWWYRQKVTELGLETWFHPTVDVQRPDTGRFDHLRTFSKRPGPELIQPGDLLHVDFGISYLRLNTDMQEHAYVLKPDEREVPGYLQEAFAKAHRLQDILTAHFKTGRTGNEILATALAQAKGEGIEGAIYTHPIGSHGHAAGPTIGMWDNQGRVTGPGDYPMFPNTAYSIELNASVTLPEWGGKTIRIMLEQDGFFDGKTFRYIDGRQEEIYPIQK
ncbi:MAG TPA: M24 family metallopeptidase [Saprospiraceae bacterium]|nr:M24 family metallopeptidase [Saprospiraceae bacterium]HNT19540.1 M24 family metallopeptidase [Saprospiraceae bacterium]